MPDEKLTQNQTKVLEAFLSAGTSSVKEVAEQAGVSRQTVYNYLEEPDFVDELDRRAGAALDLATNRLLNLADIAFETLRGIMAGDIEEGAAQKRLAAGMVIDGLIKVRETSLEARRHAIDQNRPWQKMVEGIREKRMQDE